MAKAIETIYNGYRFRSRLEARWAVFFDALEIEYQYELEGFDLGESGWYLPDFFVPKWNCWVEIKPNKPIFTERATNEKGEIALKAVINNDYRKCQKLAEQTNTPVMLIGGFPWAEVSWIENKPEIKSDYEIALFFPDMIADWKDSSPNGVEFNLAIDGPFTPDEKFFSFSSRLYGFIYRKYQENPEYFSAPMPERGNAKALVEADCEYYQQRYGKSHHKWEYFITCKDLIFAIDYGLLILGHPYSYRVIESQRKTQLTDAYKAARQARFEHGETPG